MRFRAILLIFIVFAIETTVPTCGGLTKGEVHVKQEAGQKSAAYNLPPQQLKRAIDYSRANVLLSFVESGWSILEFALLLLLGVAARMRDFAGNISRNRWVQGYFFTFLLLLIVTILNLPLNLYRHYLALAYGQSIQGWVSWAGDLAKELGFTLVFGGMVVMLLFWLIRKSPTRWWFWFWIPTMIVMVIYVFVAPVFVAPMFYKFEPMMKSNPALVERLEKVAERGGVSISPRRIFLMEASSKTTRLNAYVGGLGASKRIVVWDNAITKATPDEISFIFGHELGHYVLGHVRSMILFLGVLLMLEFYLGYLGVRWLIKHYGPKWHVKSQNDWAALVVMMLAFSILSFFSTPILNSYNRAQEHAADLYGLEVIHGIVGNPQTVAQQTFQLLGEQSLSDPNPNSFMEFWMFSHPSIGNREAFAGSYNPWIKGQHPKYFQK
jgi:Zn-dependent protease with chaperone function